jgi:hypothetical protein
VVNTGEYHKISKVKASKDDIGSLKVGFPWEIWDDEKQL